MQCGIVLPYGDADAAMGLAVLAEEHGWDGFFVWEPVWGIDAWVSLTAAAVRTERIRLGTLLSPLSRMRPWKVAGEYATLDNLSKGRVILSVGLGAADTGFAEFGEQTDIRTRAELMDEALAIITGLWQGQPFEFSGRHYTIGPTEFFPPPAPIQQTVWVVGLRGSAKSMARAAKYQGLLPSVRDDKGKWRRLAHEDVKAMRQYMTDAGRGPDYDIVVEGTTPGDDPATARSQIQDWAAAGATWWIESMWESQFEDNTLELVARRIKQGPPV
jgi:alkanesulfonate monooxygenase SsuD/methylene tetrahydromethanopterin reductase-like flavin-dependent oxidoreductase (luciferase family)